MTIFGKLVKIFKKLAHIFGKLVSSFGKLVNISGKLVIVLFGNYFPESQSKFQDSCPIMARMILRVKGRFCWW